MKIERSRIHFLSKDFAGVDVLADFAGLKKCIWVYLPRRRPNSFMVRIAQLTNVLLHFLNTFLVQFTQKWTLGTQREWSHYFFSFFNGGIWFTANLRDIDYDQIWLEPNILTWILTCNSFPVRTRILMVAANVLRWHFDSSEAHILFRQTRNNSSKQYTCRSYSYFLKGTLSHMLIIEKVQKVIHREWCVWTYDENFLVFAFLISEH